MVPFRKIILAFTGFHFFLFSTLVTKGQEDKKLEDNRMRAIMFSAYGGYCIPSGDFALDYGSFAEAGGGILYQNRDRWLFGMDYSYFFGTAVKKDPIPNLRTPEGFVIGTNGSYASFEVFQRGFMFPQLRFGKTFHAWNPGKFNQLGGITCMLSGAWLQHWTLIQDKSKKTPQFSSEYLDGYDAMRSGPGLGAWLGYLYLPDMGKINFQLEAGYFVAFTQSRRFDFARATPAGKAFQDGMLQVRLRICFTIRSRPQDTYYYY